MENSQFPRQDLSASIKQDFYDQTVSDKKELVRQFSFSQRKLFLKIIQDSKLSDKDQASLSDLKKVMEKNKSQSGGIIQKNEGRFSSSTFRHRLKKILDNSAYSLGIVTSGKTISIVKEKTSREVAHLPKISRAQLRKLLQEVRANGTETVDLKKILSEKGFSLEIVEISFSTDFPLNNLNLEGIKFVGCSFDWSLCSGLQLKNVEFVYCDIFNLSLMNSKLENCKFSNCEMQEVMFTGASLTNVEFSQSSLVNSSFEDASLTSCAFQNVIMPGTHFLEATIQHCTISSSNLTDTVFFGTLDHFVVDETSQKTAHVTRPTTAMLVHPEVRGITVPKVFMKLGQRAGVIPLRITMQPQKVTKDNINQEINEVLLNITPPPPIPQQLINKLAESPESESVKILKKAETLAQYVDSFCLPGGEDVPPALYGKQQEEKTDWGGDYRRSILELGIIHQSFNKGIPLMGICRGFQMSNVYFGAQLIQHVEGHKNVQTYELSTQEKTGLYGKIMKSSIVGACFHHQAVPEKQSATEHLETSVTYQGIVKAAESKHGGAAPMVLLQLHPELFGSDTADSMIGSVIDKFLTFRMSKENDLFWDILSNSANAYRIKRKVLKEFQSRAEEVTQKKIGKDSISINKVEKEREGVFEIFKKNLYQWKKELFAVVEREPEKYLRRYLEIPPEGKSDPYAEEREVIARRLRTDSAFLKQLIGSNDMNWLKHIIQEANPSLYNELLEKKVFERD